MNRSLIRGRSFLSIPLAASLTRGSGAITTRGIANLPSTEPGTLGSIVATIAEKLGIGE